MRFCILILLMTAKAFASANFLDTYVESRTAFLQSLDHLKAKKIHYEHQAVAIPSKATTDPLFMDAVYISSASPTNATSEAKKVAATPLKNLVVLISGVHGLEGAVGSALQRYFLQNILSPPLLEKNNFLLLHAVNPYGFHFGRRVTENNVDLNRNFSLSKDLYKTINKDYINLNSLLNPVGPASAGYMDQRWFYLSTLPLIVQYGVESLRKAILKGQYQFSKGIYFGGREPEFQQSAVAQILTKYVQNAPRVLVIDLHTGYGEKGHLHLLSDQTDLDKKKQLQNLFTSRPVDYGQKEKFYTVTGGFVDFIETFIESPDGGVRQKPAPASKVTTVVFEFGTKNSQTLSGSLESLYIMVRENQKFHWGASSTVADQRLQQKVLEMYNPPSAEWRSTVTSQFQQTLTEALYKF